MSKPKLIQSLDSNVLTELRDIARSKGITVQELIRAVVIPEWMRNRATEGGWRKVTEERLVQSSK